MLIKVSTAKTVSGVEAALQSAVEASHFGVMQIHNLKETMVKNGLEFAHEFPIFKVCQPRQAKRVLQGEQKIMSELRRLAGTERTCP